MSKLDNQANREREYFLSKLEKIFKTIVIISLILRNLFGVKLIILEKDPKYNTS